MKNVINDEKIKCEFKSCQKLIVLNIYIGNHSK